MAVERDVIDFIEMIREFKKMSIKDLCNNVVSERTYTRYLSKQSQVPLDVFDAILKKLSVPLFQFGIFVQNTIITENMEEALFADMISNEAYDKAYDAYYTKLRNKKKLLTRFGKKTIPIAMKLLEGHRKIISRAEMESQIRSLIALDALAQRKIIYFEEIESLLLFLKIASQEEIARVISFLKPFLFKQEDGYRIFTGNVEAAQMTLYQTLLIALTKLEDIDDLVHEDIKAVTNHFLDFHIRSKQEVFDVIIFEILFKYLKKHNIKNDLMVFHYIASVLSQPEKSVDLRTLTFDADDVSIFLRYLDDDAFLEETMYERLCTLEHL